MENCKIIKLSGTSKHCLAFEAGLKNLFISPDINESTPFATFDSEPTLTAALTAGGWYMPHSLASYETAGEEPKFNTTKLGRKFLAKHGTPALKVMIEGSPEEYNGLLGSLKNGKRIGVLFLLEDGSVKGWNKNGELGFFAGTAYAFTKGVNDGEAPENYNAIEIYFDDYESFTKMVLVQPTFDVISAALDAEPEFVQLTQKGAYASNVATVSVTMPGLGGVTGLAVGDFTSNYPMSAVADNGDGTYGITFTAPAGIISLQVVKAAAPVVMSNVINIPIA